MKDVTFFLNKMGLTTKEGRISLIKDTISLSYFVISIVSWIKYIFNPINDYLQLHTLENTEPIVIYAMLGTIVFSVIVLYYSLGIFNYYSMKGISRITKLINGENE